MTRLLVLGLLLVILRLAVKSFSVQLKSALTSAAPGRPQAPGPPAAVETLVRCARCGTYVAAARALQGAAGEERFCSQECMERGAA